MSVQYRPVCAAHAVEMRCARNDFRVVFRSVAFAHEVQSGDLWSCPVGGEQVVIGWGNGALAHHSEPDFEVFLASADMEVTR